MINIDSIKTLLETFNRAYQERNTDNADDFMRVMFDSESPAFITGTSNAELCFDYGSIKNLFVSDWQHWGDVHLDIDRAVLKATESFAWVHCPATIQYKFSDNNARHTGKELDYSESRNQTDEDAREGSVCQRIDSKGRNGCCLGGSQLHK
jgi:hypothetical protein